MDMDFKIVTDGKPISGVRFCYWTVATGDSHSKMAETMIHTARSHGVEEDFHVWSDKEVAGSILHKCLASEVETKHYLFKFIFLRDKVSKLDYDYFIFLDTDNVFVRKPENILSIMGNSPVFVCMENEVTSSKVKRDHWWGCPTKFFPELLRKYGVTSEKIYNTNAGFWIVKKDYIEEVCTLALDFWKKCQEVHQLSTFTEEPALAFVGHMLSKEDVENQTLQKTAHIWASDWTGNYRDKMPDGNPWFFVDYLSAEKIEVNPCIVHAMRSKTAMISLCETRRNNGLSLIDHNNGFWIGHHMLGDVLGFCSAASQLHEKTGDIIKVNFQESRKGLVHYFTGVKWVPREEIPKAIDCGREPSKEEWLTSNGVKRFYRFMDPSMESPMPFDVRMNVKRKGNGKKEVGFIVNSVTQGDIDRRTFLRMYSDARREYPEHRVVLLGEKAYSYDIPKLIQIEDRRDSKPDFDSLIENIRGLDLLVSPQTGPCFIAAALKIPMWIYRSKIPHWDSVLNYDTYKVCKWYDRNSGGSVLLSEYENYIISNNGIGDILCQLNSLNNLGIENNKIMSVWVEPRHSERLFSLYNLFNFSNVRLIYRQPKTNYIHTNQVKKRGSFINDMSLDWGCCHRLGQHYMSQPKDQTRIPNHNVVGVSFTTNDNENKDISDDNKKKVIDNLLAMGKKVIYFGYFGQNRDKHEWLLSYGARIEMSHKTFFSTTESMKECQSFVGIESGLTWLSVFLRVHTTVLVSRKHKTKSDEFTNIDHCNVVWEDEYIQK